MSYWRFAAMIATSTLVMFGLMYIHTYVWDHVRFSETRAWMALLMGAVMAIVMLVFMLNMYTRRAVNIAIVSGAALTVGLATWLIRAQATVDGTDYMEAMIPHHSIAILTSERARIEDPRVRKLADEIIEAQRKEIAEMKYLIRALDREGVQAAHGPAGPAKALPADEAVRRADVAKLDLEPITGAELQRMLGAGPVCHFAYGPNDVPVAVAATPGAGGAGAGRGAIKLHGRLVAMAARYPRAPDEGFELSSGGGEVIVVASPDDGSAGSEPHEADARLQVGQDLNTGYRGFYACTP